MSKRSISTLVLTAALAFGGLALATVDASAQRAAPKGDGGTPPAGGTTGGAGDDGFKIFLADKDCRQAASTAPSHCRKAPPVRVIIVSGERCLDVDHPRSVSPWGQVIINQRKTKIKYCDDLHTMQ